MTATLKRHNEHGTLWRPNGAVLVNVLVRFLRDLALNQTAPFDKMIIAVSTMTNISVNEMKYLSDIGEWILLDRGVTLLDDEEYDEFWNTQDIDLRAEMLTAPHRESPDTQALNEMWSRS